MQFEYNQIESFLRTLPISMSTSECHGVLTGLCVAAKALNAETWAEFILDESQDVGGLSSSDLETLAKWCAHNNSKLDDSDFSFELALPDDEQDLKDRLNALAEWCHGFLYGLAATGEIDFETLPAEASETLSDLGEIGKIDAVASLDDGEAEADLLEIVEYVRMAVLSLFDDVRAQHKIKAATEFIEKTIH